MADMYTGADDELDEIVEEAWVSGSPSGVLDLSKVWAWRDAAVAKHLAEAGAVHPAVHTPNRVMQWLGEHGWQAAAAKNPDRHLADRLLAEWVHAETGQSTFVHLDANDVNYAGFTAHLVAEVAGAADLVVPEALLEISAMPDVVAW